MQFKNLYLLFPLILILLSSFSNATVYEDGENNTTKNWRVYDKEKLYDKNSTILILENIFDKHKKSNVIKLKGTKVSDTYLIGDIDGANAWNNKNESIFSWSMKIEIPYQLILFVNTTKGFRYIYFSHTQNADLFNNNQYIHINLDSRNIDNKWKTFSFDIASKIKSYEPDNKLISINGFSLQGSGLIDDIKLTSSHNDFISTFELNKEKKLYIETNDLLKYNFNINWGDGSNNVNVTKSITHQYEKEGIYTININGEFPQLYQLCENGQKLLSVEQWGTQKWKSMKGSFKNCKEFTSINTKESPNLSHVKSMYRMFYNAFKFNADISSWDVSAITDMSSMFYHAESFNQDIGAWNLSSVKDTSFMFNYALNFNRDISHWDVSSVEDMQLMFRSAKMFNQDISKWDVSSVKKIYNMFKDATSFNQNLESWDTSSVRDHSKIHIKRKVIPENASVVSDIYNELEQLNNFTETP